MSLTTEVKVQFGSEIHLTTSEEIGQGGMALSGAHRLGVAQPVQLSFTLPDGPQLVLDAVVWWKRDHRIGIRFDPRDSKCLQIGQWVDQQIKQAR